MPSPRKRALRAACGNILGGAPSVTQIAYADAWWNTVITEHAYNYQSNDKPFINGELLMIGGGNPSYDGLISGGEPGSGTGIPAFGKITAADGDAASGMAEGQFVHIKAANGQIRNYVLCTNGSTALSTGDQIAVDGDMGAAALPNLAPFNVTTDSKNVVVKVTFSANQATILNEIRTAINGDHGHNAGSANSVLQLTSSLSAADGAQSLEINNATAGTAGNVAFSGSIANVTYDGMLGGVDAISSATHHYWMDTTNGKTAVADAVTAALTTAEGVLYDPSGPWSKYIPAEATNDSFSTATYVVIKPTGWNSNDYITWELIGDTEASNDKLSMVQVDGSNSATALNGTKADGTMELVTTKAGTVAYTGRTTYASANANGIAVLWEADGTGADAASVKKGWYLRWKHTAV